MVDNAKGDVDGAKKELEALKTQLRRSIKARQEPLQLQIAEEDIKSLQKLDQRVKELEKRLRIFTMNLDMEKICVYIQQEVESSIEATDQRMFIAEITLIDKQISSMVGGLFDGSMDNLPLEADLELTRLISLIDDDELLLICRELADLKNRLGLDTQLVPAMDWGSVGVVFSETLEKLKLGIAFFGEGTKMLVSDMQYAWKLIIKAAQGYTLKPREVNSIRRTGKDLLTLVPFTIILIIPLSPVGHVLVFSFIQVCQLNYYNSKTKLL